MSAQELSLTEEASPDLLAPLLRRVAAEDRLAFHELYLYASPRLYGIALALTRDRQLASEALQDAMVQVWRQAVRFDPAKGSAEAWMSGILRFRALDLLAAAKRRLWRSHDLAGAAELADDAALERLESTAVGMRLRSCLALLEQKNRQSIILAYVHGYSHRQIATRLQLPLGTVKAWIRRGIFTLKTCFEA
jgi:RNA polymerase sigma-70 factor (ECF subfamily)